MNLQLATEVCKTTYVVNNAPRDVSINATTLRDNVMVYCLQVFEDGTSFVGYLAKQQKSFTFHFPSNGKIYFYAMLLPSLFAQNGSTFDFLLGVNDGSDEDFDGTEGAKMTIKFAQAPFTPSYAPYNGQPQSVFYKGDWYEPKPPLPFLLNINHSIFQQQVQDPNNVGITFTIDADPEKRKMLEQNVWIHFFDGSGKLLGVADTQDNTYANNVCNFPYLQNGFQFAAFIEGQATTTGQFTFAIGDPETDAKVSVDEVA